MKTASGSVATGAPSSQRERTAALLFRGYKRILSPLLHASALTQCKYLPTCSEYAYVAVVRHGWWRGSLLALGRLARCHPFAEGGADPVPERRMEPRRTRQRLP